MSNSLFRNQTPLNCRIAFILHKTREALKDPKNNLTIVQEIAVEFSRTKLHQNENYGKFRKILYTVPIFSNITSVQ